MVPLFQLKGIETCPLINPLDLYKPYGSNFVLYFPCEILSSELEVNPHEENTNKNNRQESYKCFRVHLNK